MEIQTQATVRGRRDFDAYRGTARAVGALFGLVGVQLSLPGV